MQSSNEQQNPHNFIDIEPIVSDIGQIEHQTAYTKTGNVVDHNETRPEVVDSNGLAIIPEEEKKVRKYIQEAVSVENLLETFKENTQETLYKLLALQDNKHPLKKGGIGIAYRTDALIMHCKMEFTAQENIVFDAILGTISSFPEDKVYKIEPSSFKRFSKYANDNYLYTIFNKGTKSLKQRHLEFENLGPDNEELSIPWFDILKYHNGKKGEAAYVEFIPSDFFKVLALSSQLVHGAYGALEVTMQLQGKYTIALYWFLENKKKYKEYPTATPGVFHLSIDELKHQFSIPNSYTVTDLERKVLGPAKQSINAVSECDFTFEYTREKANGVYAGYKFEVKPKAYLEDGTDKIIAIEEISELEQQIKMLLKASFIEFSDEEIHKIYIQAARYNRDSMYMMQIIVAFKQRLDNPALEKIDEPLKYICKMIELGSSTPKKTVQNNFNNMMQNNYDYDELEKKLLDN